MGLSNPIINLFLLLPLFPQGGQELLQNEELLDSFVWELHRHNGPVLSNITKSDTEILDSSGEKYSVKADTILFTDLSMVNRDPAHWKNPHVFKAERFFAGEEPAPVTAFGCPINQASNQELYYRTHQCIFRKMAHPFLKQFVTNLLMDYSFRLDQKTTEIMQQQIIEVSPKGIPASEFRLHVDYSFEVLNGGINNGTKYLVGYLEL